jgi:uncharacterized delta-60 repeat protein
MRRGFILMTLLVLPIYGHAQEWVARYNGPGNSSDDAQAIAVDVAGNVYVTGWSWGSGTSSDYATIKYNSSGDTLWVRRYNGPGNSGDVAEAIALDGSGNVYVTGYSYGSGTSSDYATIKYNSSGDTLWVRRYTGPVNDYDKAQAIALDGVGNVYVTGVSYDSGTGSDYATIKYNPSGDTVWVRRYNGPGNSGDVAEAIALDGSGNVYVTGYSYGSGTSSDYATIKYNSSGVEQWVRRYDGPGNDDDYAEAIALDGVGNVYVTGYSYGSGTSSDYATIKYNSSGDEQWIRRYNGPGNNYDYAYAIALDGAGNVYVTGWSEGSGTYRDYATIKYNSSGDELWAKRYNGPGNDYDYASAIALDGSGNVYVTGVSYGSGTSSDYATIKYNPSGVEQWIRRYNGPGNSGDAAYAIALDGAGNVYVTGYSYGSGTYDDYATIKYSAAGVEEEANSQFSISNYQLSVYPNPCIRSAVIGYRVAVKGNVNLSLYDISGGLVRTIYSGVQEKGYYTVELKSNKLAKSIYFIKFQSDTFTYTKKLVFLK